MKAIIVALLLLPLSASADFQGRYSGPGSSLSHKSGLKRKCSEIFVHLGQTPSQLQIHHGGYKCENLQATLDPFTLDLKNGKIFFEGEELGTFDGKKLDLLYVNRAEDYTYHWVLEESEGSMSYTEEWTDRGSPALTVSGVMQKLPEGK